MTPPMATFERAALRRQNPCPATGNVTGACPGYVTDHQGFERGGPDVPSNMQWQTIAAARAKGPVKQSECGSQYTPDWGGGRL